MQMSSLIVELIVDVAADAIASLGDEVFNICMKHILDKEFQLPKLVKSKSNIINVANGQMQIYRDKGRWVLRCLDNCRVIDGIRQPLNSSQPFNDVSAVFKSKKNLKRYLSTLV